MALHRAAQLARTHPESRVLLTTFSDTLASALQTKLKRLLAGEPRLAERIDVYSINTVSYTHLKKCVRVAGPFTVESMSPHRMLGVDENDELIDLSLIHI